MLVTDVKIRFLCRRLSFLPQDNFSTAHHSLLAKEDWKILQKRTGKYCKMGLEDIAKGDKKILQKGLEHIAEGTEKYCKRGQENIENGTGAYCKKGLENIA